MMKNTCATPNAGAMAVEIAGRPLRLCYTINSLCALEDRAGMPIMSQGRGIGRRIRYRFGEILLEEDHRSAVRENETFLFYVGSREIMAGNLLQKRRHLIVTDYFCKYTDFCPESFFSSQKASGVSISFFSTKNC